MRNVWTVFKRDLLRILRVPIAAVIVGGALVTPALYAWFNIVAFWDPFDNTRNLDIAVVSLDEGASNSLAGDVNVGEQLIDQLKDNHDLGWHFFSTKDEALDAVRSGQSYAAFVVPASFSKDLLSLTTGDFTRPELLYYVNEKLNGVAPEITDTGATTVQTQMVDAFTQQVADAVATAVREGGGEVEQELLDLQDSVIADLEDAADVIGEAREQLVQLQADLAAAVGDVEGDVTALESVERALGDLTGTLNSASSLAAQAQSELIRLAGVTTTGSLLGATGVGEATSGVLAGVGEVSAAVASLAASVQAQETLVGEAETLLRGLEDQLEETGGALSALEGDLGAVQDDMGVAIADVRALSGAALWQDLDALTSLDPEQIASFMATPVEVDQHTLFETKTYGSQMAALFINLSLWIGAFVLVVILRTDVDKDGVPGLTQRQAYLGRWLLFAALTVAQATTLTIGNLIIGVQHTSAIALFGTSIFIGLSYLSVIFALSVTFGYIGKGLAVILVIMQIPGASGIYPIQLMPEFFQALYPWFPFTYGIDAMREVISGFAGLAYWRYTGMLLVFVAVAFLLGLVLRRHVANLTRLFTQQVARTELFTSDSGEPDGPGFRIGHVLGALANRAGYNEALARRVRRFGRVYGTAQRALVASGVVGALALPFLGLAFPDAKVTLVGLWILWLILVFAALVTLEYLRFSLQLSTKVGQMSETELKSELTELEAQR
ncbi:YhgE/Pip domain-containing protein [Serinibacter salmoneus]|uniref:Putative membrane protein n=1 Tax=Serinibacter salmoneus TaxID=556530 RepID=A0A2A9CXH4_9MICO|nr:YhgE/Pip domain-containing protein [Serinibacter salmoneus]PFG18836.1 putative membrane protein [Serinibacter salmoneus]